MSGLAKLNSQESHIILKNSSESRTFVCIYRESGWRLNRMPLFKKKSTVGTIQVTETAYWSAMV